jgi:NADP-dependent 3-hydroxyisobutyrate dehydrogenase-like protein
MKTILDIVNASSGRNSATEDKFLNRILHGRYDAGFTAKLQLKDIRLYLEAASPASPTMSQAQWWTSGSAWTRPCQGRISPTCTVTRKRAGARDRMGIVARRPSHFVAAARKWPRAGYRHNLLMR